MSADRRSGQDGRRGGALQGGAGKSCRCIENESQQLLYGVAVVLSSVRRRETTIEGRLRYSTTRNNLRGKRGVRHMYVYTRAGAGLRYVLT